MLKHIFVIFLLLFLAGISASVIYIEDIRYSMPTPVPQNYREVPLNTFVSASDPVLSVNEKPKFIHFFNPHCPCSRFNLEHFRDLISQFSGKIDFAVVLQTEKDDSSEKYRKLNLQLPFVEDKDGKTAEKYGVYSTPQAVILDKKGRIYYRGNYNKSRYCSLRSSEYARLAAESLLREQKLEELPLYAVIAYGCQLPLEKLNQKRNELREALLSIF